MVDKEDSNLDESVVEEEGNDSGNTINGYGAPIGYSPFGIDNRGYGRENDDLKKEIEENKRKNAQGGNTSSGDTEESEQNESLGDKAIGAGVHEGGKVAAGTVAGPVGGVAYDAFSKTKVGQKVEGLVAKKVKFRLVVIFVLIVAIILLFFIIFAGAASIIMGDSSDVNNGWLGGMNSGDGSCISVNGTSLSREEFVKIVQNYSSDSGYQTRFGQYAGVIYDICKRKNINPVLVFAQAKQESGFGKSVPSNSKWNYWGIGVYNDTSRGTPFSSIEQAVEAYCDIILGYQSGSNAAANASSKKFAQVDNHFTNNMSTIYDIYSAYAYLGDYHTGTIWDHVNVKKFLTTYIPSVNCTHGLNERTTIEEQAAYIVWYVDDKMLTEVKKTFGEGNCSSGGNKDVKTYATNSSYKSALNTNNQRISAEFWDTKYHKTPHKGMDIAATSGTEIVALGGGKVVESGLNSERGWYIRIDHGKYCTLYQHMLEKSPFSQGETVKKGNVIGKVGSSGHSTGPHLHLELWVPDGQGKPNWKSYDAKWDVADPTKFDFTTLPD